MSREIIQRKQQIPPHKETQNPRDETQNPPARKHKTRSGFMFPSVLFSLSIL
jgi:hypothetical protein